MSNFIEWTILVITLCALFYAAIVIKNEKINALANSVTFPFGDINFLVPTWWTKTIDSENKVSFERTDTRYDWCATFYKKKYQDKSLQNILEEYAIEEKIIFDLENKIIHAPNDMKGFSKIGIEALRLESTATWNDEKRIYIDITVFKNGGNIFILENKSSVLNGLLEGPFFEQMLETIKKPN